ncbi:alanine--tRNA ligase [Candidatus Kaiserbacteria bacterium]|nr:alanine--tRNA ligase [Candidatus Kaiserbacteria bacterium]
MTVNEIRAKYLEFFEKRGHFIISSASLVPHNDPTTLFTGSGMQPLIPYLLGKDHPAGKRLANSQKSFRTEDIEEVGDNRHTTFFEMLGNWSLGDYFKKEELPWLFEFLTDEIDLDPSKLYVTAFAGDERLKLSRDTESAAIWKELFAKKGIDARDVVIGSQEDGARLGMQGGRIFYYDATKNWWSRAGAPENMPAGEPGGPDSEIFYDFGLPHDARFGDECHPNCDCGRFLEIGNSVFMQYIKKSLPAPEGSFGLLPKQNVDFGGGLERIAAASENSADIFAIDVFSDIIGLLIHFSKKEYTDSRYARSFRIIADHIRAATFIISDGVKPSNTERGYVLRRLIRRAAQHALKLSVGDKDKEDSMLVRAAVVTIEKYKEVYPELDGEAAYKEITETIWNEEKQFALTLERGMREFERIASTGHIEASEAYTLFTTHGFPFEMTLELAKERGIDVDEEGFKREMKKHQEISRAGVTQKFRGGLADTSEKTTRLHTAHHLLLKALQVVLGAHVKQRGSNITQERLRIDFSHGEKMSKEQLAEVERIVNEKIQEGIPVIRTEMSKEEAEKLGAEHEFGAKYPERVSVYSVGPLDKAFSIEYCGGPHVSNTSELKGTFKIQKEEAVAAGIRRIKAVLQ